MVALNLQESLPIGVEIKFNNLVHRSGTGATQIFCHWDQPLLQFDLSRQLPNTFEAIRTYFSDFFAQVEGANQTFRYSDPSDYRVTAIARTTTISTDITQGIAFSNGDGSIYQLYKSYNLETVLSYRPITRPVDNASFKLYSSGIEITTGFTVDFETGQVTFATPDPNLVITWEGEFDVLVRFGEDAIAFVTEVQQKENCTVKTMTIPTFNLVEVREQALVHPTPVTIPERITHSFALEVEVKEQEQLELNTSITIFDSGYEIRQGNYFADNEGTIEPRIFRRFTTGGKTEAVDDEIHYLLCWWRCTRGGSVVFQHNNYQVQARDFISIDVKLEYKDCLNTGLYDIGGFVFAESDLIPSPYLPPPYNFPLTTVTVDPQDPQVIDQDNPGLTTATETQTVLSEAIASVSVEIEPTEYEISTYSEGVPLTGFTLPLPPATMRYAAAQMFWAANSLWLVVVSQGNTVPNNNYFQRGIIYRLNDTPEFTFVASNLQEYYSASFVDGNLCRIFKTPTGVSMFCPADDSVPFNSGRGGTANGLLRFEIQDDGTQLIDFIPNTLSGTPLLNAIAVFDTKVFVNVGGGSGNVITSLGTINGLEYVIGNFGDGEEGYPVNASTGASVTTKETEPQNIYFTEDLGAKSKTIVNNMVDIETYFVANAGNNFFDPDLIYVDQSPDGSVLARIFEPGQCPDNTCAIGDARLADYTSIYLKTAFDASPQQLSKIALFTGDAIELWAKGTRLGFNRFVSDRNGNGVYVGFSRSFFYRAGSGHAIEITGNTGTLVKCNEGITPFGFALFSHSSFLFEGSDNPTLIFVQI